ncbi:AraC family ligand binding domain-containing protein, partial [Pseudomonas aeruginosa]
MPDETSGEHTHFWRAAELGGVELLHARYVEQRFAPHVHSGFALVFIEQGAQRFRHRGGEHLAPWGSMVLINPDEVHTGSKAHDSGWLYRGYYPEVEQIASILDELEIRHGGVPRFADSVVHDQPLARAFVHLHRLLADHAGSLETQTCWRETLLALFRRHARLPEAPKAGSEPLAVARARELLA